MLGYDVAAHLPELRHQAESRFTETFTFYTQTEDVNPETLTPVTVNTTLRAGVPGRVRVSGNLTTDVESAGQGVVVDRLEVHVAVGSFAAPAGTLVIVTASTFDAALVGRIFRVHAAPSMGQVTAWRHPVEDYGWDAA